MRGASNTGMVILVCVHAFVDSMTERRGGICGVSAKGPKTLGARGRKERGPHEACPGL